MSIQPPPIRVERLFYLKSQGQSKGPFSLDQLRSMHTLHEIPADAQYRSEDGRDWKPISELLASKDRAPSLDRGMDDAFNLQENSEPILEDAIKSAVNDLKALDYRFLIPFGKILSPDLLRKKAVRWVLIFGVAPLAMWKISSQLDLDFQHTVWMIALYFCSFWALYFYGLIKPSPSVWHRALGYASFTAFIGIPVLLAAQKLPLIKELYAKTDGLSLGSRCLGYLLAVGPLEEITKAVPLLIFGLRTKTLRTTRDGLFLGFMSGLGFAAAEGVNYTINATNQAASSGMEGAYTTQLLQVVFRMMTGPILHGAWAGIVGWFIGVAAIRGAKGAKEWPIIAVGIALMATLHGINDILAGSWWHVLIAAFSVIVFMAYFNHEQEQQT